MYLLITSGKQISNNYVPYFNRIDFVVIPSYVEIPWLQHRLGASIGMEWKIRKLLSFCT